MNRSTFNKAVVPGLFSLASESYTQKSSEQMWKKLAKVKTSKRSYEESAYWGSLGLIPVKPEGTAINYDEMKQGPTKRWTHRTYGLGVRITEELIEDSLYDDIPTEMSQMFEELGKSANETLNVLSHDVINSGTATTSHTDGLAVAIFGTGKARLDGGTWDNLLSPASDLSATALQAALDTFENTRDDAGRIQIIRAKEIWVHPNNAWKAKELLNSAYDPESANNAVNTIKERNLQLMVSPHLTDTDAFYLVADAPHSNGGIIAFMRRKTTFAQDGDFDTGDALFKSTFRFSVEVNKPNNIFASVGA